MIKGLDALNFMTAVLDKAAASREQIGRAGPDQESLVSDEQARKLLSLLNAPIRNHSVLEGSILKESIQNQIKNEGFQWHPDRRGMNFNIFGLASRLSEPINRDGPINKDHIQFRLDTDEVDLSGENTEQSFFVTSQILDSIIIGALVNPSEAMCDLAKAFFDGLDASIRMKIFNDALNETAANADSPHSPNPPYPPEVMLNAYARDGEQVFSRIGLLDQDQLAEAKTSLEVRKEAVLNQIDKRFGHAFVTSLMPDELSEES